MKKAKNDFQAQRDVLKSLAEGGPGSTRWGDRSPQAPAVKVRTVSSVLANRNTVRRFGVEAGVDRNLKAQDIRKGRSDKLKARGRALKNSVNRFGAKTALIRFEVAKGKRRDRANKAANAEARDRLAWTR